ncbi:MAG: hypothetical protein HY348_06445 [Nitrospira defluvii]|nr:hypothetical protein [Nitrospira defluvii]
MKKITSNAELVKAIRELVNYNWADERRDFIAHPKEKRTHIFVTIQALNEWAKGE